MERIHLKYIKNYRDLGGILTKDGRQIKEHMLIRGTTLKRLHREDVELLVYHYGLSTIIDLRTKKETEEMPDVLIEGVKYISFPLINEAVVGISHEKKVHSLKSLEMMPKMEDLYIKMVTEDCQGSLIQILKKILLLPEGDFAVAFHCSAGKDRTGILAALLLAFLGVDKELIIKDYLYTNKVTKIKAKIVYLGIMLIKFRHNLAKKISMYYIAKKEYLSSALTSLEREYGSLDNFFKVKLNLTDKQVEEIRNKFLSPANTEEKQDELAEPGVQKNSDVSA